MSLLFANERIGCHVKCCHIEKTTKETLVQKKLNVKSLCLYTVFVLKAIDSWGLVYEKNNQKEITN